MGSECVECQQCDFELNAGSNREPMKTGQHRRDCDRVFWSSRRYALGRSAHAVCSLLKLHEEVPYSIELQ